MPSVSVMRIVKQGEVVLRSCVDIERVLPGQWERMLVSRMLAEMPSDVFPELLEHSIESSKFIETHHYMLMKLICQQFIKLRRHHTVKLTNLNLTGNKIRHHVNKNVLFKHQ